MQHVTTTARADHGLAAELFDPDLTPVRSSDLQDLLDEPAALCDVLCQHIEFGGHAPASTVDLICSTFRDWFSWWGGHSVLEIGPAGWRDFIASRGDAYERALCCQTLHQSLDLLGVPSPHHAPLPDPAVVPGQLMPAASTIETRGGRKPTRKLAPLELAVARYAVLPQLKGTTVVKGRHCPPRRDQFVAAVTLGGARCLVRGDQLAALQVTHIQPDEDQLMLTDNNGVYAHPITLDDWTTARLRELLAHDLELAYRDDFLAARLPVRHRNDRFARPLLYGGRHGPTSASAVNTMNAKIAKVLERTGLARAGLTALSVRLAGADEALANGAIAASVAAQLGLTDRGRPDVDQLAAYLGQ